MAPPGGGRAVQLAGNHNRAGNLEGRSMSRQARQRRRRHNRAGPTRFLLIGGIVVLMYFPIFQLAGSVQ